MSKKPHSIKTSSRKGPSNAIIATIFIIVVLVLVILFVLWLLARRRQRQKAAQAQDQIEENEYNPVGSYGYESVPPLPRAHQLPALAQRVTGAGP
jgi:flagellar biosynthesis/type III secretory pathway M-ring protein FliF/YscJ